MRFIRDQIHALLIARDAVAALSREFTPMQLATYNNEMLFDMPQIGAEPAVILGSTAVSGFAAIMAANAGHRRFIAIGGKAVNKEDPRFTEFMSTYLRNADIPPPPRADMPEKDYIAYVLINRCGIDPDMITVYADDTSKHSSANMEVLKRHGWGNMPALEMYTLSGTARRVMMTGDKVLGTDQVRSVHNAFPTGLTVDNWHVHPTARAFIAAEAAKCLPRAPGKKALYVEAGHCAEIDLGVHMARAGTRAGQPGGCDTDFSVFRP